MEEIILKSAPQIYVLSNKCYKFKHIKTGNTYTFIETLRSKNPLNGELLTQRIIVRNLVNNTLWKKLLIVFGGHLGFVLQWAKYGINSK